MMLSQTPRAMAGQLFLNLFVCPSPSTPKVLNPQPLNSKPLNPSYTLNSTPEPKPLNPKLLNPEPPTGQEALHELDRNQPLGNGQLNPHGGDRLAGRKAFCSGALENLRMLFKS